MHRRKFISTTALATMAGLTIPNMLYPAPKIRNIGIQLYTVRAEMLKDPRGTLEKLASLGVTQIESARSAKGNYYGLSGVEMKNVCEDLGMKLRSGHVAIDDKWQATIQEAAAADQEYLICASLPQRGQTVENYQRTADIFNRSGEECKKAGLKFGYHNHDYEFDKVDGQILYDVLLDNTDPRLVHMELDLGWVVASGNTVEDYFKRYRGRFPLWHLKDMDLAKKESTELGKGGLNIPSILSMTKESGLKYFFVEQEEYSQDAMTSMEANMKYLRSLD